MSSEFTNAGLTDRNQQGEPDVKPTGEPDKAPESDLWSLIQLAFDAYWELDADLRFTKLQGRLVDSPDGVSSDDFIGREPWAAGLHLLTKDGWAAQRDYMLSGITFRDLTCLLERSDGRQSYVNLSGEALYDRDGKLAGYRGTAKDITERRQHQQSLQQFQIAMDASQSMIYVVDRASMRFVFVNQRAVEQSGYSRTELLSIGPHTTMQRNRDELAAEYDELIAQGGAGTTLEVRTTTKAGLPTIIELHRRAVEIDKRWFIVTTVQDISARKLAERSSDRLQRMYAALSATNEAILHTETPQELYQRVCEAAVDGGQLRLAAIAVPGQDKATLYITAASGPSAGMLRERHVPLPENGRTGAGLAGLAYATKLPAISNDFVADERTASWHELARSQGVASGAAIPVLQANKVVAVLLFYSEHKRSFDHGVIELLQRMADNVAFALGNFAYQEERQRNQQRIQHLATHDALTELPNRVMFSEVLRMTIENANRYERRFAVLFIDLDRFKIINDTLGHEAGDQLLQTVSRRLQQCLRASDLIARIGGDEFVLLLQEVSSPEQIDAVANKLLNAAIQPVSVSGHECRVTASIGVAMYPAHGTDADTLMKNADIAMYQAKEEGKNNHQYFSEAVQRRSVERMSIENHLRRALERNELSLHYQAKVDLNNNSIHGVEALLRWHNPELGEVSPTRLIPVAEDTGLIVPIGRWILRTACQQSVDWVRAGLPPITMAVNLSPRQFSDPQLVDDIQEILEETGLPASQLELEITESVIMNNAANAAAKLHALKRLGVRTAIDDFGTGYSSLAQLKRFPVDVLKVDRSFIRDVASNTEDQAITQAVIHMGKSLNLTVIAEGVETPEQQQFLRAHECDEMQGFYFSRPVSAARFAELLATHRP